MAGMMWRLNWRHRSDVMRFGGVTNRTYIANVSNNPRCVTVQLTFKVTDMPFAANDEPRRL